jgi:hypothetical protein
LLGGTLAAIATLAVAAVGCAEEGDHPSDTGGQPADTGPGGDDADLVEAGQEPADDDGIGSEWGTTYYVRTDGGDATQCTGLVDRPYSGTGLGQPCAFRHPFVALPPGGTPRLAGGDRLVIGPGAYRMGQGAPTSTELPACDVDNTWDCMMPALPSGPDTDHPTRIVGAGWDAGCADPPELFAVERPWAVLDLRGSSHVRVDCLEITDHSDCVESHSGGLACPSYYDFPHGDYGIDGIVASDSTDVLLRQLDVHGLPHDGIHAYRLTDWTLEDVRVVANGWSGWNGDDGGDGGLGASNAGTLTFRRVTIAWNGCGESYPDDHPVGCWAQTAGGYGDGLGTGSTGGSWVFEDCDISHNTSDGLDLLYHDGDGEIRIERTRAVGNAGNQIKTRGDTLIVNAVIVGNCADFEGRPWTHHVDACRAGGNALALSFGGASQPQAALINSTVYSEGDCLVEVTECDGEPAVVAQNNVFLGAPDATAGGAESTCFIYAECGDGGLDLDYNVVFGTKHDEECPWGAHDLCQDPLLSGPLGPDTFELSPRLASPAVDSGLPVGALGWVPATDIEGTPRPQGPGVDRGAYERPAVD